MNDIAANKDVAVRFFETFSRGDLAGVFAMMTPDAVWWVSGRIDGLSGDYPRDEFVQLLKASREAYKGGPLVIRPSAMIAEGDKVAIEAESFGEMLDGRTYNNRYHFLVTIRDGKVAHVKEYMDTQHVVQVFMGQG